MTLLAKMRRFTRSRRSELFRSYIAGMTMKRPLTIVDLGGTVRFWEAWGFDQRDDVRITLVNNHRIDVTNKGIEPRSSNIVNLNADATELEDGFLSRFDLVFSNSFIEHLEGKPAQRAVARSILESGRPYFIQTPNKHAPVDPHFPRPYAPFFGAYPKRLQARILTWTDLGSGYGHPCVDEMMRRLAFYTPLSTSEVRDLLPDAEIVMERPLGVPMSIIAYKRH